MPQHNSAKVHPDLFPVWEHNSETAELYICLEYFPIMVNVCVVFKYSLPKKIVWFPRGSFSIFSFLGRISLNILAYDLHSLIKEELLSRE